MRFVLAVFTAILLIISAFSAYAENEENSGIKFSGILEEEFGYNLIEDDKNSDFALATAQLGAEANLGENVSGSLILLYEQGENDNNIAVDEGVISLGLPLQLPVELSLSLGLMAIPFGEFNSHFVTDPYTLEIGETKQVGLLASANYQDIIDFSFIVYNEEIDNGEGDDHANDIASRLAFSLPEGALGLSLGASFINNIAGTDGLTDMIGDNFSEKAKGLAGFASLSFMEAFLEFEYIAALEDIKLNNGNSIKPNTFNIELGYSIPNTPVDIAGKFERYSENDDDSVDRFGGVVSFDLFKGLASFALEYLRTNVEDAPENSITGQLAISF